jgi:hypothetical protein
MLIATHSSCPCHHRQAPNAAIMPCVKSIFWATGIAGVPSGKLQNEGVVVGGVTADNM